MFKETTQKAVEIARQFSSDFPPSLQDKKSYKIADKFERALLRFRGNIATYQKEERMWYVRRVVFANALQSELLQIGFPTDTVRQLMSDGLTALSYGI